MNEFVDECYEELDVTKESESYWTQIRVDVSELDLKTRYDYR
jgi:hypothetical protein